MKLISCHIDAFGKFKDADFNFDSTMNVFCEKNGFGKTTLAEFVKAMFYSLPSFSKKANFKSERDLYKPLDYEGRFGGRLTFSCKKGKYIIVRQFGSTPTLDKFYLFDAKTNLISNDFSSNIGEELFGVGKETFENSTFFGQQNLISGINDDIRASLSVGVLSGDDIDNFEKAQNQIQKKIKEYKAEIKTLNVDGLSAEYERYKAREEVLKIKIEKVESELKNLALTQKEIQSSDLRYDENEASSMINKNIGLQSVVEANNEKIMEKNKQKENLLNGKKLTKEDYDFVKDNVSVQKAIFANKASFYLIFIAILGGIALLCGGILKNKITLILGSVIALAALFGIIFCLFIARKNAYDLKRYHKLLIDKGLDSKSIKTEILNFEKVLNDIKYIDEELIKLKLEIDKNNFVMKNLQKQFEMKFGCALNDYYFSNERRNKRLFSVERQIIELNNDVKHYLEDLESLQEKMFALNESINSNDEKGRDFQKKILLLTKVSQYLIESRDAISNRFIEPVSQRFNRYYKQFLNDGEEILIDSNLGMRFGSKFSEIDFLSAGLSDLVYICKRFALVDLLFKKEKPVLILDDPFANFDDEKLNVSKEILEELKNDYQILLFTCQKART